MTKRNTNMQTNEKIDEVNNNSINDEKIIIGKADMQSNEKINEFE